MSVRADGSFISPNLALRLLSNKPQPKPDPVLSLSESEERTLRLIAEGLTNREIGERMGVTEKTIKFHVGNILKKLNVKNRVEAALIAKKAWHQP
jgi:two-component system, NarL family, nitrate/nitrite response regulator NarL